MFPSSPPLILWLINGYHIGRYTRICEWILLACHVFTVVIRRYTHVGIGKIYSHYFHLMTPKISFQPNFTPSFPAIPHMFAYHDFVKSPVFSVMISYKQLLKLFIERSQKLRWLTCWAAFFYFIRQEVWKKKIYLTNSFRTPSEKQIAVAYKPQKGTKKEKKIRLFP